VIPPVVPAVDMMESDSIRNFCHAITHDRAHERLDILINNAGAGVASSRAGSGGVGHR
jgi:NAD(P)-dependent dehydrogenase (short-subunit alcohol dehydrogenase family)